MNERAERYVKLALALGRHDPDYVDAYLGPPAWREECALQGFELEQIAAGARRLLADLTAEEPQGEPIARLRHEHLAKSVSALLAHADQLGGRRLSFDEESLALYDARAPRHDAAYFQALLDGLEGELPGRGDLAERYRSFKDRFIIRPERLDRVFAAAVDAGRAETRRHLDLPAGESFRVEYVSGRSWSGYNWYQGGYHSLIQVNVELPVYVERAVDLACHEGYPGHHVYNALVERDLVRGRGWQEFSIYPLFSPRSLIAEGTANFGIEVAFPPAARLALEREVIFPLAGLDPDEAAGYYRVEERVRGLGYAGNEAARRYLDGEIDEGAAIAWLTRYALMPRERAAQRIRFFDQYRSYVINYNLGQDLVAAYVARRGGTADLPEVRWQELARLLTSPCLPSHLVAADPAG